MVDRRAHEPVAIPLQSGATIAADLTRPVRPAAVVVFAHGSGSSRHSPRNRLVADVLVARGFATLLVDLFTVEEEAVDRRTRHLRFDIELLAERVRIATGWARRAEGIGGLPLGVFGASTGGAAALVAAADDPGAIGAVVSRGGRPDLAGDRLPEVTAPTLLVVGGADAEVLDLNRRAAARLGCAWALEVVPDATHLFEEPGALEAVAALAADWFDRHLAGRADGTPAGSDR